MKNAVFVMALCIAVLVSGMLLAEETKYDLALKYYKAGRYEQAVKLLEEHMKEKPEPAAYYLMGYALHNLNRHEEARGYFESAYLIAPELTPGDFVNAVMAAGQLPPEAPKKPKVAPPAEKPAPAPAVKKAPAPTVPPVAAKPAPAPQPPAPQVEAPRTMPGMPPELPTAAFFGAMAAAGMLFLVIGLAFYIYFALCHFLIGKKLDVPASWLAWVPIVNIFWPLLGAAGKRWWWGLLMLVPLVNIVVIVYLWMCITENTGRNRWLGLLMLAPVVTFVFIGLLAFAGMKVGPPAVPPSEFPESSEPPEFPGSSGPEEFTPPEPPEEFKDTL